MGVFTDIVVILYEFLELDIFIREQPLEEGFLNFLVIFFFKELVVKHADATQNQQLSSSLVYVECCNWSVGRIADRSRGKNGEGWFSHIE